MDAETTARRVRGAVRNAVVWGVAGFTLATVAVLAMGIAGLLPDAVAWANGVMVMVGSGIASAAAGGAFSMVTALLYRGQRLCDISAIRFGLAGGIVTGVFVPLFLQTMNLISGDGMVPWSLVLDDGLRMSLFGAAAAGASLKLAQRADARLGRGAPDAGDHLPSEDPVVVGLSEPVDHSGLHSEQRSRQLDR